MKKKGILVAACLVFCGLFVTQPAFAALYSGAWEAVANGTLTTTEYGDSEFGFYDYNNEDNYYGLSNGVNTFSVSGNQVTVFSATDAKTDTLTFSLNDGSVEFGFYMKEANGSTITFFKELMWYMTLTSACMY